MIAIALFVGVAFLAVLTMRFEREDRAYLGAGYAAHVLTTFAFLWFYSFASGDMDGYEQSARAIRRLVQHNPLRWIPELAKLIAHQDSDLLRIGFNDSPTTAAAHGWAGVAQVLSGGDELAAACLIVSTFSFLSKALLFGVVKEAIGRQHRTAAALGTLFVPSVLFWSSGLIKEAFAIIGLGLAVFALYRSVAKRQLYLLPLAVFGLGMIASVKPYILLPVVLAAAVWVFAARRGGKYDTLYILAALIVAFAGVIAMGQLFPQFGIEKLNDQMAGQRHASETIGGGSFIGQDAKGDEAVDRSLAGNIAFLPLGLVNALLRPFLFEVRSVPQLAASLENGALFILVLFLLRRHKLKPFFHSLTRTPLVISFAAFALVFAAAVGLSSKNLGTVSRYRVPLMPAYVTAVLVLRRRLDAAARVSSPKSVAASPLLGLRPRLILGIKAPPVHALRRAVERRRQMIALKRQTPG